MQSIFEKGLISRVEARNLGIKTVINDIERFDHHPDSISLSISFPNYQMFYKLNNNNQEDWVILLLSASILWSHDCAFCFDNAANRKVRNIKISKRKDFSSLVQMFSEQYEYQRDELWIPDNFPTNPQAEVLVFNPINPALINKVHFKSIGAMERFLLKYEIPVGTKPEVSGEYFAPRCDCEFWKKSR